ncbi:MAG: EAL domain-containing protein [Thalassotalea sp.]
MTDYRELLESLTCSTNKESNSIEQLITTGLYMAPALFSINRAGLWILDDTQQSYVCHADYFDEIISHTEQKSIAKFDVPELFNLLNVGSEITVEDVDNNSTLDEYTQQLLLTLHLRSILLIPLQVNNTNKGFIFLGNSDKSTAWSLDMTFTCRLMAKLFGNAILLVDNKAIESQLLHQHQLMNEIETLAKIGGWEYEISTGEINWTDETYRIYGVPLGQKSVKTAEQAVKFYSPEAQECIRNAFDLALSELKPYEIELPFIDAKGQHKWIKTTGRIRSNAQGPTHIYGAIEDISEQKRLLDWQKSTSENLKIIVDNLNDSIVTISDQGIIRSANSMVMKTFGYSPSELIGNNISILMPEPFASKHDKYMQNYLQTGKAKIIGIGRELPAMKKDGSHFPMELSISEVLNGSEKVFIGIVRDITERKKAEKEIHQLAYYDETTGALNRYSFERDLKKHFDKSLLIKENITVLLVNLDKFSQINLAYGESVGDALLKEMAKRLKKRLPTYAISYRGNADSFYIILNFQENSALEGDQNISHRVIVQQIFEEINQEIIIENNPINIQASIGILNSAAHDIQLLDIKPLLELAVFNAKQKGGNCFVYANSSDTSLLKRHSQLSVAMKGADFTSELAMVLQPQYSTEGKIVGSEALVRWHSPVLGFVSPAEFIPLAEKNGSIIELGNWIITRACELLAQRRLYSKNSSPISVNISAKQIAQPNFSENLLAKLDEHDTPYNELVIELTESALIADFDLVINKMQSLKNKGIHFSIDDFGTGYSSLSYIHHLPISELKIDKCFVDGIKNEVDEVPIINTIIQLARSLKLKVVAEGVENIEQLNYLTAHKCDVIQGYYFSKPQHHEQWLKNWSIA